VHIHDDECWVDFIPSLSFDEFCVMPLSDFPEVYMPYDQRSSAQLMRLSLLRAQDLVDKELFNAALAFLEHIKPWGGNHTSTFERIALRQRDFAVARVYRFQGRFQEALECFKRLLHAYVEINRSYYSLLSHISGTLVELGDVAQAEDVLLQASSINKLDNQYFKISLAEAKLYLRSLSKAERICQQLKQSHEDIEFPDTNASWFYVRVLTVLARVAQLEGRLRDALLYWERCLEEVAELGLKKEGFTSMICKYSIADIALKMGDVAESRQLRMEADAIFKNDEGRRHWATGLGTIWLDAVRNSIMQRTMMNS
jgi:tetratricopeptide (TPR) repeat protein